MTARVFHGHDAIAPVRRWRVRFRTGLGDRDVQTTIVPGRSTDEAREAARRQAAENGVPYLATIDSPRRLRLGVDEANDRLNSARLLTNNVVSLAARVGRDLVQAYDLEAAERHLNEAITNLKLARRYYRLAEEEA